MVTPDNQGAWRHLGTGIDLHRSARTTRVEAGIGSRPRGGARHRPHRAAFAELTMRLLTLATVALSSVLLTGQDSTLRWEAVSIKPVSELPLSNPGPRAPNLLNLPYTTL